MEKINVAELLKGCPSGMELDCAMYENVYFDQIFDIENCLYSIGCYTIVDGIRTSINFTKFGEFNTHINSKCLIFPKGKTTWEGFVPPCKFKDGDVISNTLFDSVCIFKGEGKIKGTVDFYCGINTNSTVYNELFIKDCKDPLEHFGDIIQYNFATEEEKEKLFKAIKDNGYKWNSETKTLDKLIEPKFKDGDIVTCKDGGLLVACIYKERKNTESFNHHIALYKGCLGILINGEIALTDDKLSFATEEEKAKLFKAIKYKGYKWNEETKTLEKLPKFKEGDRIILKDNPHNIPSVKIKEVTKTQYLLENGEFFYIKNSTEEKYVLEDRFDITTLTPFESRVLIRDNVKEKWHPGIWGYYDNDTDLTYPYKLIGVIARYCIPYEGNEHLLGTTYDCDEYFKTWK